ncbi:MAG TPA: glycosyltransferase [Candidatus Binatia bacterium]|nr:glycosyltransferase [Candidatus Binatia bacterium]
MMDAENDVQRLRTRAEESRLAKLRALGREMDLRAWLALWKHDAESKEQGLRLELENTRGEVARLRGEVARLSAELEAERLRIRELQSQLEHYQGELRSLLNSRSWKLTQPMRDAAGWAREHLSRNREGGQPSAAAPEPRAAPPSTQEAAALPDDVVSLPGTEVRQAAEMPSDVQVNPAQENDSPSTAGDEEPRPEGERGVAPSGGDAFLTSGREAWDVAGMQRLDELLHTGRRLRFPSPAQPAISIIVVLYRKPHLALLCLESILTNAEVQYELVLVDNDGAAETDRLLEHLEGAKVVRNRENVGFGPACMQAAGLASGEFLCFLNSDAVLARGSLEVALASLRQDGKIGALGGKILFADGRLQEAGMIVWNDGTAWGYGRGDNPELPRYEFRRPVDYGSAAFLVTPRALFDEVHGFDPQFSPAYYEDADYCFKLWDRGLKVIYEPGSVVHHYESASFEDPEAALAPIASNQAKFAARWRGRLARQLPRAGERVPYARISAQAEAARIVYFAGHLPHRDDASGFALDTNFLTGLVRQGHYVTCVLPSHPLPESDNTQFSREVEWADAKAAPHYVYRELLSAYDGVWIEGRENMREFLRHMWNMKRRIPPIVYQPRVVLSHPPEDADDEQATREFEEDRALCQAADIVIVESEADRQLLRCNALQEVRVWCEEAAGEIAARMAGERRLSGEGIRQ